MQFKDINKLLPYFTSSFVITKKKEEEKSYELSTINTVSAQCETLIVLKIMALRKSIEAINKMILTCYSFL